MINNGVGIGNKIKARRIELGLSQTELAQRLGYASKVSVCKVENGADNLTSDRIAKFAKALECDVSMLMGWGAYEDIDYNEERIINEIIKLDRDARYRILQKMIAYEGDLIGRLNNGNSKKDT